jgi:hypothetical protein
MYDFACSQGWPTALARSVNTTGLVAGSFLARDGTLHALTV